MTRGALVVALVGAAAGQGGAAPLVAEVAPGVTVDWTRGVVIARGVGPADRNAPTPAIARVAARRAAIEQARARLRTAAAALPAVVAPPAPAIAAEVEHAPIVGEDLGTDGSVRLSVVIGIEALRQAAAGPRAAPADERAPSAPWIVDARAIDVAPAIGLALASGGARWQGPILYRRALPDPAAGASRATAAAAGRIDVEGALPPAGVAVVVVVRPEP